MPTGDGDDDEVSISMNTGVKRRRELHEILFEISIMIIITLQFFTGAYSFCPERMQPTVMFRFILPPTAISCAPLQYLIVIRMIRDVSNPQ